jgi:hypothetical protein
LNKLLKSRNTSTGNTRRKQAIVNVILQRNEPALDRTRSAIAYQASLNAVNLINS